MAIQGRRVKGMGLGNLYTSQTQGSVLAQAALRNTIDCPGGPVVKNSPENAGGMGSIPGPEDPTC